MTKINVKSQLKRKKELENQIDNLQSKISILEREVREINNWLQHKELTNDEE